MTRIRQTKIVATLGPATDGDRVLDNLIAAGMNCARINCSHGTVDEWRQRTQMVRDAADRASLPIAVMFDLQGTKMRLAADTETQELSAGQKARLTGPLRTPGGDGDGDIVLQVAHPYFLELLSDGSEVVFGDGTPRMKIDSTGGDHATATVTQAGELGHGKGVTVINARPVERDLAPKDVEDLHVAIDCDADFVAISYVRGANDVDNVRALLGQAGSTTRLIAKIERIEAYEVLDEIIEASDGIMVARGDLGVAVGIERVPIIQKDMIRRGTQAGKLVITATQMVESMINSPQPTRAEAADVANAVIDGTSAIMLSAETSIGKYPVEAVATMASIASVAETEPIQGAVGDRDDDERRDAAVMHAALYLAYVTNAAALIVPTTSGNTPRACNKYRPKRRILAVTSDQRVARQLSLEWGVEPIIMERVYNTDLLIHNLMDCARDYGHLEPGDLVVVTAGQTAGRSGSTDLIALREIGPEE